MTNSNSPYDALRDDLDTILVFTCTDAISALYPDREYFPMDQKIIDSGIELILEVVKRGNDE